ncbi:MULTISPECIES: hypothetical protein [unclassified Streptomyces]|uniref:hypothetical protein n=1 Tax=unclassified Streptomyces TaxID=2593676 RepID=UPI0033D29591
MARNFFGGTAADAAENESGGRLPNLKGRVYASEDSPDVVKDLLDASGNPLKDGLLTDERGMIPAFQGPDGVEQLWVDFNSGRVMLTPNDVGKRLASHLTDLDPHGSKAYTNDRLAGYVALTGPNAIPLETGRRWLEIQGHEITPSGDTLVQRQAGDDKYNFALRQNGSVIHVSHSDNNVPLEIQAGDKPHKYAMVINDGKKGGADSAFKVDFAGNIDSDGHATVGGDITVGGTVTASNIGTARVFSGTVDPATQGVVLKPGDIWVQYGS